MKRDKPDERQTAKARAIAIAVRLEAIYVPFDALALATAILAAPEAADIFDHLLRKIEHFLDQAEDPFEPNVIY